MSNDKIAKARPSGNIVLKVDWKEFNDFEFLIYNTDVMISIISESVFRLLDGIGFYEFREKEKLKQEIIQIELLCSLLKKQSIEVQSFLDNTLKSS
jgi:hypothetical protein